MGAGTYPERVIPGPETRQDFGTSPGRQAKWFARLGRTRECSRMDMSDAAAAWRRDGVVVLAGYLDGP